MKVNNVPDDARTLLNFPSLLTDYKISNFVTFSYSGSFGKK